jgi:hypothetical protein
MSPTARLHEVPLLRDKALQFHQTRRNFLETNHLLENETWHAYTEALGKEFTDEQEVDKDQSSGNRSLMKTTGPSRRLR